MKESQRAVRPQGPPAGGQILIVFALGLVAFVAMVGLVIDGGNLFGQQRIAQNGVDSSANAGALVVAQKLAGAARTGADVAAAVDAAAAANGLVDEAAEYTDVRGNPIGAPVDATAAIPDDARGVRVSGDRVAEPTFTRVIGFTELRASAEATVVAGALSAQCVASEDGCTLLPVTFPVTVFQCDSAGEVLPGTGTWIGAPPPPNDPNAPYWQIVGAEDLPSPDNPTGNQDALAILPLCRGSGLSSGTFGWLDLVPGMNLANEIVGPINTDVDLPDWFQAQTGNPNSVEDELKAWIHEPVLIPLHNQACRVDPGDTEVCPDPGANGNNTWYYVHTLAVFVIDQVYVQGNNKDQCASPPGLPLVPVTNGTGFLGCLKGWFANYITSGPVDPGGDIVPGVTPIGIQLIR